MRFLKKYLRLPRVGHVKRVLLMAFSKGRGALRSLADRAKRVLQWACRGGRRVTHFLRRRLKLRYASYAFLVLVGGWTLLWILREETRASIASLLGSAFTKGGMGGASTLAFLGGMSLVILAAVLLVLLVTWLANRSRTGYAEGKSDSQKAATEKRSYAWVVVVALLVGIGTLLYWTNPPRFGATTTATTYAVGDEWVTIPLHKTEWSLILPREGPVRLHRLDGREFVVHPDNRIFAIRPDGSRVQVPHMGEHPPGWTVLVRAEDPGKIITVLRQTPR